MKLLWVREHSCLACGFEGDRDANVPRNILARGIEDVEWVVRINICKGYTLCEYACICKARLVGSPTIKELATSVASE